MQPNRNSAPEILFNSLLKWSENTRKSYKAICRLCITYLKLITN